MKPSQMLLLAAFVKFCLDSSIPSSLVVLSLVAFEALVFYWNEKKLREEDKQKISALTQRVEELTTSISTLKIERAKPGAFLPGGRV